MTVPIYPLLCPDCHFLHDKEEQWTINPGDLYRIYPALKRVAPTHFFFLFPNFGSESRIEECSPQLAQWWFQAGRILSRHMTPRFVASALDYHERCFELYNRLQNQACFYKVLNGNLADTINLIDGKMNP